MSGIIKCINDKQISRRQLLSGAGKAAAGLAVLSAGGIGIVRDANAYGYKSTYKYAKLDPDEVGRMAYENYFTRWCTSTVIAGLVLPLQKQVGGSWKDFPIDAYRWAHGGLAGWGALCGTMPGAGVVIGLVTDDTDTAEAMVNDLAFYYSNTQLPTFKPKKALKAEIHHSTTSNTPVCHISVGKWMKAENKAFLTDERAERCARLSANVAMYAANMLNDWADGKYKPKHPALGNVLNNGITSQNNCTDCHGSNIPKVPGS
jgi:hypothetical protein